MKIWLSKLVAVTTTIGLCTGVAFAQPSGTVTMKYQSVPALLKRATPVGAHPVHSTINLTISLKLNNVDQLKIFLNDVQNLGSSEYRKFLTPTQFTARYGPTPTQLNAVVKFLKEHGITVKDVSPNRVLIHTQAATGVYEHAFGIRINDYESGGRTFFSTMDAPKLPASIAGFVQNVIGLDNAAQMHPFHHLKPLEAEGRQVAPHDAPPPQTSAFYRPAQIATAYDWPSITDTSNGAGVTTAILTADSSGLATNTDYTDFWSALDLPGHTVTVIPVDGDQGAADGMIETLLDVEWSGAMGPGEAINVYVTANPQFTTFTDMYNQFVNDNTAQVMTTSWGAPEIYNPEAETDNEIFMQGAAQGISMFAASGDHGSGDGYGGNLADFPSSSPYITAANGTEMHADINGNWISETAWTGTGGAVSQLFEQPDWQTGPGVPVNGWRNNSDMAANAGGNWPYLLHYLGVWGGVWGTSAVAPVFSGLFAIGVSMNGNARLGQSNKLLYDDVNAGNYATDFRDIIMGNNGLFSAGPDWDHPTGWGSPLAASLLSHLGIQGPKGVVEGTVTDSDTGAPIAGATVSFTPGISSIKTDDAGHYSVTLAVGDYTATVGAFGYMPQSSPVIITDGGDTVQDFALASAPNAALRGRIHDQGHGYPLYAEVKVTAFGSKVADVWTNPKSGSYRIRNLPIGTTYKVTVTAYLDGFTPGTAMVLLNGDTNKSFDLLPDTSCTAPGYIHKFGQDFNGIFPPEGWTVTNEVDGSPVVWNTNTFWGDDNWTGGTGMAATADSNKAGINAGPYDTSLISPPISVADLGSYPVVSFLMNFNTYRYGEAVDVDISTDGGNTWTTMDHITKACGTLQDLPGCQTPPSLDLSSYISGVTSFQLRWRYYDSNPDAWDWYIQIDDVAVGDCKPIPGGLVEGRVYDRNTKLPIGRGALVTDENGNSTQVVTNAGADGFMMFEPTGEHTLTVAKWGYQNATKDINVADSSLMKLTVGLAAGKLRALPQQATVRVPVNTSRSYKLHIVNRGTVAADWQLTSIDVPPSAMPNGRRMGTTGGSRAEAPLQMVRGKFSPRSLIARDGQDMARTASGPEEHKIRPHDWPWIDIAAYPIAIADNCAIADHSGKVYSFDGSGSSSLISAVYVYDPVSNSWSSVASDPTPRDDPACAYINGKFYLAGGWVMGAYTSALLEIYDPSTDTWSTGADDPVPHGGGAVAAVLNGKMYLIGGCEVQCGYTTVEVYDPATDSWSPETPYPHDVSWEACGAIDGKIYCAGGASEYDTWGDGYMFDPNTHQWSPIADLPVNSSGYNDLWGMGYAVTNGRLIVSNGITNDNYTLINEGFAYDPATDSWSPLPNSNVAVYRGGSACGFYRIGGAPAQASPSEYSELLPGYDQCSAPPVPWLSFDPASGTLAKGNSIASEITIDGTGQTPGTTSVVQIKLGGNTPYPAQLIPLTVHWTGGNTPSKSKH